MALGDRLSLKEETEQQLFSFNLGSIYRWTLLFTFACFAISLAYSTRKLIIGPENFEHTVPGFMKTRKEKGYVGKVTFHEVIESLDKTHPLHKLEARQWKHVNYYFGSTIGNHCFRKPYPNVPTLPSLLRLFEFHMPSQFWTRMAILSAILIRVFMTLVSVRHLCQLIGNEKCIGMYRIALPLLEFTWMVFAMLIVTLHQDQDKSIKWFMTYHLPGFAISFILYAVGYVLMCTATLKNIKFQKMRMMCILVFVATFPQVYGEYLKFLEDDNKVCYADVPLDVAIMEYCAIASVLIFTVFQFCELNTAVVCVSVSRLAFDQSITETDYYTPFYLKSKKCHVSSHSLKVVQSEKSRNF